MVEWWPWYLCGGYTVSAARTERRIKTLATVSMVDIGALFRKGTWRCDIHRRSTKLHDSSC